MPWVAPKTDFVNGDVLTATQMNNIGGDLAMLNGGTTGQVLSKASNANGDFAWTSETDPNAIPKTLIDAKGDLIAGSAADTAARLAVGTNNYVLTADSTTATGLKWAAPASGGWTVIGSAALSGSNSVTISSIPGTYKFLRVWIENATSGSTTNIGIRCNGITTGSYYAYAQYAYGGSAHTTSVANAATWLKLVGTRTGQQTYNNSFVVDFANYTETTTGQEIFWHGQYVDTAVIDYSVAFGNGFLYFSGPVTSVSVITGNANFSGGTMYVLGM